MRSVRRRRNPLANLVVGAVVVVAVAGSGWLYYRSRPAKPVVEAAAAAKPEPARPTPIAAKPPGRPAAEPTRPKTSADDFRLVSDEHAASPSTRPAPTTAPATSQVESRPAAPVAPASSPSTEDATAGRVSNDMRSGHGAIEAARRLYSAGKTVEARTQLNNLLKGKLAETEESEVRSLLTRIADETVFSRNPVADDPLVEAYTVVSGDVLINIGKKFEVPAEALMTINAIRDARTIRVNQKLKVPRGPFNVKITKSKFRLDVYLGEVYVRSYRVGLGAGGGTPEGVWKVKERLANPTYYPPSGAGDKRIIAADDPNNPLGEHWIGLQGIEGDAVGHEGYGIHGTIEPDSIGKAVSLGCIRMHNEDVALLYQLLMPGRSTVTIVP